MDTPLNCKKLNETTIRKLPFEVIAKGNLYGAGGEGINQSYKIVQNEEDWQRLIEQMSGIDGVFALQIAQLFEGISVNFSKNQVIAIFDQVHSSGGHSIDVVEIIEYRECVIVRLDNYLKGDDTLVLTQPFQVITIANTQKSIVFEFN